MTKRLSTMALHRLWATNDITITLLLLYILSRTDGFFQCKPIASKPNSQATFLLPHQSCKPSKRRSTNNDVPRSFIAKDYSQKTSESSTIGLLSVANTFVTRKRRRRHSTGLSKIVQMQKRLDTEDNSLNDNEAEDAMQQLPRKRDMIKEWIYGTNGNKDRNMIRPIRIDGSTVDDENDSDGSDIKPLTPRVVRNAFGNLFSGMPSLNEILGTNDNPIFDEQRTQPQQSQSAQRESNSSPNQSRQKRSNTNNPMDESWFENERKQIVERYNDIFNSMLDQIAYERAQSQQNVDSGSSQSSTSTRSRRYSSSSDFASSSSSLKPDAIPDNAEALIRSILKQEMEKEINTTKERLSKELLASYEQEQISKFARQSSYEYDKIPNHEKVQKLISDSENEYNQQEKYRKQYNDFLKYENEAKLRYKQTVEKSSFDNGSVKLIPPPANIKNEDDLDLWVLERFQEMIELNEKRMLSEVENDGDGDGTENVLDNLENNLQELTERIQSKLNKKDSATSSFDNFKDWQMYRSIATQRSNRNNSDTTYDRSSLSNAEKQLEDEKIIKMVQSWKEYIRKEEHIRRLSGLSTLGPKLPFAWQEADLEERLQQRSIQGISASPGDDVESARKLSKNEIRKRINRMSIDAMESLIRSPTIDQARKQNLQKELDYLKATLEKNDYLDVDDVIAENDENSNESGAIDTANLFRPWTSSFQEEENDNSSILSDYYEDNFSATPPSTMKTEIESPMDSSRNFDSKATMRLDVPSQGAIKPPSTPFFMDSVDESEYEVDSTGKLGSMEDQKLESMYRRAGAKTAMERALIKKQYEQFKEFEKARRDESGLSNYDAIASNKSMEGLKYNISEVLRDDGDFDADKVLQAIGPRPVRRRNRDRASEDDVDQEEVIQSRYRAVSAIGGGRYKDDPEAEARQLSSYEEYIKKESLARQSLDSEELNPEIVANIDIPDRSDSTNGTLLDDAKYAEEVIATLGSRPKPKRARIILDERSLSDSGGVRSIDTEQDLLDDDDDEDSFENTNTPGMPEWLRREQQEAKSAAKTARKSFLGSDMDEMFDDTDYEHNMRQLAEYERRRAGDSRRPMGIDISDVLGPRRRSLYQSDDYADYKYDINDYYGRIRGGLDDWGTGSFEARKRDLLDYIELDVKGINALMDHKDSVHSTGVSQYQRRINKPFKEFGAIFRLEGVLIDVSGLHLDAWTKVAKECNYKVPSFDDIRRASVTRAEVAVKDIFCWTDDFMECKNLAQAHRDAFRIAFDVWKDEVGIKISANATESLGQNTGALALGLDNIRTSARSSSVSQSRVVSSESEKIEHIAKAWTRTALAIGMPKPQRQEVLNAMLLKPDIAIKQIFRWANDPLEIETVAQIYRKNLRILHEGNMNDLTASATPLSYPFSGTVTKSSNSVKKPLTQNEVMELSHQTWTEIARKYNFEPPLPEESMAAFVINDPEITVREGFGWTTEPRIISDVVKEYQQKLSALTSGVFKFESGYISEKQNPQTAPSIPEAAEPSSDELFEATRKAWLATAKQARLSDPDNEQIVFAMSVGPEEAIKTGFQWAETKEEVQRILDIYRSEIGKGRSKWTGGPKPRQQRTIENVIQKQPSSAKGPTADDVFKAAFDSWTATAQRYAYPPPDQEQVLFAMSVGPEEAIMNGFEWTRDTIKIKELVATYRQELARCRSTWQRSKTPIEDSASLHRELNRPKVAVVPGSSDWIESLISKEMQCGIISYLELDQVEILLRYSGLDSYFPAEKRVTATNNYRTDDDQLLGMALRLERRPDHCAVFDCTPYSSVASHNVEMQSVSIIGIYPSYELLNSDATTASFTELTAMNIRRLFGERIYDQPLEEAQAVSQSTRKNIRRTTTFMNDDE